MKRETPTGDAGLERRQQLLLEVRDKLCGGSTAELARSIKKAPSYVSRLFYPPSKKGHKGLGLELMHAVGDAFYLPDVFWTLAPPALSPKMVEMVARIRGTKDRLMHDTRGFEDVQLTSNFGELRAQLSRMMAAGAKGDNEEPPGWGSWGGPAETPAYAPVSLVPRRLPAAPPLTPEAQQIARWFDRLTDPRDRAVAETRMMAVVLQLLQQHDAPPTHTPAALAGPETPPAQGPAPAPAAPPKSARNKSR